MSKLLVEEFCLAGGHRENLELEEPLCRCKEADRTYPPLCLKLSYSTSLCLPFDWKTLVMDGCRRCD